MGSHPINLAVRFLLEIAALLAMGYWGWSQSDGVLRILWALALPLLAAALWAIFAVPDDPSRSGKTVVPTRGFLRLLLELVFFGFAVWALYDTGATQLSWILGIVVMVHYALSYDRIGWLLRNRSGINSYPADGDSA